MGIDRPFNTVNPRMAAYFERLLAEAHELYISIELEELQNRIIKGFKEMDNNVTRPDVPLDFGQQNQVKYEREGKDLIDRWHDRYSIEEFRVLMWAMMEKYNERLGKKDNIAQEVRKIADYAQRWADKEG